MESLIENLKKDLQCSLCNNTLTEPKLLQCFHTFCKSCIQRNAQLKEQVHVFNCPSCSYDTLLKELIDVENLQTSPLHSRMLQALALKESEKSCSVSEGHSPALWQCLDCDRSLCDECLRSHSMFTKDHQVISLSELKKEDFDSILRREKPCKTHLNHTLEYFCKDCDVLVCMVCLKDNHHKDHITMILEQFESTERDLLSKTVEKIDKLREIDMEKQQQEEIAVKMKSDAKKAEEDVKNVTKRLVKRLIDQEQQLLDEIQKISAKADRNLRLIRHIPAAQEYITSIITNGIASDMVDSQEVKCSERLIYEDFQKSSGGIVFEGNEELSQQLLNAKLGNVRCIWKSNPDLTEIHIKSDPIKILETAKLSIVTKLVTGDVNYDDCDVVDIQITPANSAKVIKKTTKVDGKIEIEFMPRVPGQLRVEVKLNGIPVSGSPVVMNIKPQQIEVTESALTKCLANEFCGIRGIAANKSNSMIAVAHTDSCVNVFNMDGNILLKFGGLGVKQGQLNNPEGLSFLNDVDLVIVDNGNNRLCIVNTVTGTLVKTFGRKGNGNKQFSNPHGVHVDDDCNIIVSDSGNRRVQVFTKDGNYQYQFTVPDVSNFSPHSTVLHKGVFYISDRSNGVIHVIEMKDGSPNRLSIIGGKGIAVGQLQNPTGLAIDKDSNLLVCDYDSNVVNKFTLDGQFIGKTRSFEQNPLYIAIIDNGKVLCSLIKFINLYNQAKRIFQETFNGNVFYLL